MPLVPTLISIAILLIPAVFFTLGKGADFISGYSLMNDKQKRQFDEKKLTRDTAILIYFLIALIVVWHIVYRNGFTFFSTTLVVVFILTILIANIVLLLKNKK
ncbi:DUF3784 domain-containing protein [Macrococcus sp. EM39E]|uniref:DUF3784 domain-containing protein n=1 Tax=Macrococcus animalis TaxID=3395467 RepID=UPI0039BEB8D3